MRRLKIVLVALASVVALVALIVVVLATTSWGNDRMLGLLLSQGNQRMVGSVSAARLRGNLFTGATLDDVVIADSLKRKILDAKRVKVRYALFPTLRGRVQIKSLTIDTAVITLDKRTGERWNFQMLMRPSGRPRDTTRTSVPPEISDVTLRQVRFVYRRPWRPDSTLTARERDSVVAKTLLPTARKRTERVGSGYQRVLEYRDINAHLPAVRIGQKGQPTAVEIRSLSMIGEPYRPPVLDVRSLVGTLYASKDSLWWRGARMQLAGSTVSGDGRIGFKRSGFALDLTGAPLAFSDLRWLSPKLAERGGGKLRYRMRIHGDTAEYGVSDADLRYGDATVAGSASITRLSRDETSPEILVHGADLTIAKLTTKAVRELVPALKFNRDGVLDGRFIASGSPRDLTVNTDLTFADASAGSSRLTARGGVDLSNGVRARDLTLRIFPLQIATLRGAGVRLPVGGTLNGHATVNGGLKDFSVSGDIAHADRGARSRVAGTGRYQANGKRIVADVTLEPLSLATVGRFAPKAGLRGIVTGKVRAEGTTRDLRLTGALRSPDGGVVDAKGTVSLAGSRSRYDISVALDALNARVFSLNAPATKLSGTIAARGSGTSLARANTTFDVDLARSSYDTFSVERIRARGALADGLIRVDTLEARESGVGATAKGTFGLIGSRTGTLQFNAWVDSLNSLRRFIGSDTGFMSVASGRQSVLLAAARADSARRAEAVRIERLALGLPLGVELLPDTLPAIRRDSLAGKLAASGVLRGNIDAPAVDASVRGSGIVARGYSVGQLAGSVSSTNVRDRKTPLAAQVEARDVQAAGRAFELMTGNVTWQNKRLAGDLRVRQDARVSYAARGSYDRPAKGVHDIRLDSLRAQFDTLVWRLVHPAAVRIADEAIVVDSVDLRSSAGSRLFAHGSAPKEGAVRLDVAAENVRVSTVLQALQKSIDGDGTISASARITGSRLAPTIAGNAMLRDGRYESYRAPDADVGISYAGRLLGLTTTARDSTGRRVLSGTASLPLDLALADIKTPRKLEGPLVADVALDSLEIGALPIRPRILEELSGRLAGDAQVRGTWIRPLYTGHAALRDGALRFSLASTGMRVTEGVADMRFSGDSIVLDSLVARARNLMRASGTVDLSDRKHPFVRAMASGRDIRVFDSPRGLMDADAEVFAVGPLDSLRVTGGGKMNGGYLALKQFRKDLLRVKAPGDPGFVTIFDTSAARGDSLRIARKLARNKKFAIVADLSVVIERGNFYRNRPDANTEFYTGEDEVVRAHLDQRSSDQWAVGFVRIGEAGITLFRTRAFLPVRGSMTFAPHTDAAGAVQQVGERIVWEPGRGLFPVQLFTGGTTKGPSIGLESGSQFPIRGRELNGYLTMGRLSLSLLQQSGSSLSGSTWSGQLSGETGALARRQQGATALGVVLHALGVGATKEYAFETFSVSPADVPTELVFGKTGGVRGALVEGGRYLTADSHLSAQLRFTSGIPGIRYMRRVGTTYRFDIGIEPRFLFRQQLDLGITHPTDRSGAFGAFLTRMWDF